MEEKGNISLILYSGTQTLAATYLYDDNYMYIQVGFFKKNPIERSAVVH